MFLPYYILYVSSMLPFVNTYKHYFCTLYNYVNTGIENTVIVQCNDYYFQNNLQLQGSHSCLVTACQERQPTKHVYTSNLHDTEMVVKDANQ